jgi:hypothetical protein
VQRQSRSICALLGCWQRHELALDLELRRICHTDRRPRAL